MTLAIKVYWSFRSPWSYLATPRLASWQREYDLDVVFRPVYPIAIRTPDFFKSVNPLWFPYFMRDVHVWRSFWSSRSSGRTRIQWS